MSESDNPSPYRPRCKYLNCKAMVVFGENFENDPDFQAGQTEFWCNLTARGQGPDDNEVSLEPCSSAERACFQEF